MQRRSKQPHLELAVIVFVLPLQEVNLFKQFALMKVELPHVATDVVSRTDEQNTRAGLPTAQQLGILEAQRATPSGWEVDALSPGGVRNFCNSCLQNTVRPQGQRTIWYRHHCHKQSWRTRYR